MQGQCSNYWSSSPVEDYDDGAWYVFFYYGYVSYYDVVDDVPVRCVRDAP